MESNIESWASALERDLQGGIAGNAEQSLVNMLQFSEMTPALSDEVSAFRASMASAPSLSRDEVTEAVQRLAAAAKAAGPNKRARALLLD